MLQDVVSWNGDQRHWNIPFARSPNDGEGESVWERLQFADITSQDEGIT